MKKVILHFTSNGFEWFCREVLIDESNYQSVIDQYVAEFKPKADSLFAKWELEGWPDPLYLDFTMSYSDDVDLYHKISKYTLFNEA